MANELIYNVKINGIDVATQEVDALNESVGNLGNTFAEVGGEANLNDFNQQLETTGESVENLGNQLDDLGSKPINLPTDGLKKFKNEATSTTEKIDKLSGAGEKGFKGLSDALKLFGVDTTILDTVKDSLGALGDLLGAQEGITKVAFDSGPIVEQAEAIKTVETAQKASTVATVGGTVATNAAAGATTKLTIAQRAFNLAASINPYIALVAGIIAVIGLVKLLADTEGAERKRSQAVLEQYDKQVNATYDNYSRQISKVEQQFAKSETQGKIQLDTLNAQLNALESQGGSLDEIAKVKKQILAAEIQSLEVQIQKNNLLNIEAAKTLNDLETDLIGAKREEEQLLNLKKKNKLDEDGIKLLESATRTRQDIEDKIATIEKGRQERQNQNLQIENEINLKKTFGLQQINAQTKAEKEKLRIQEEQARLQLEENQRKLNEEIEKGKKSLLEFADEYKKLVKNIQDSIDDNQFELQIQLGDISGVINRLTKEINSIPGEIAIEQNEVEKRLAKPIEGAINTASDLIQSGIQSLRNNIDLLTKDSSDKLDKFFGKLKEDTANLELNIKESKSLEESKGKIKEFVDKLKSDLNQEFKLGNISPEEFQRLNGVIDGINGSLTIFAEKQNELKNIPENPLAKQEASSKVLLATFKDLNDTLGKSSGVIEKNFNKVIDGVSGDIDKFQKDLENAGIGDLFRDLISKEDADKLKERVKNGVEAAKKAIDEQKVKVEDLIEKVKAGTDDPKIKEFLDQIKKQLLGGLDETKAGVEKKGEEIVNTLDTSFLKRLGAILPKIEKWANKLLEIFQSIGDFQTQLLENQAKELEDYYDNRNEVIEGQLEKEQEYQDRQGQIISDSQSRLNELEGQLQNARGSRAAFLQKLRAEEQARLQKAEAEKIAAANREKKLAEEQKKLEAQKAAELEAIEKKKFEIQKRSNIAQIIVNTALAFTKELTKAPGPPTVNLPFAIAIAALGAIQLATASAAKYAKGGLLEGPSHSNGGIPIMVNGGRLVEAEGGEYIINKKSTATNFNLLKKINENPDVKFQNGGMVPSSAKLSTAIASGRISPAAIDNKQNLDAILTTINDNLSNISVQASIQDIRDANAVNMQIEDLRRI